MGPNSLSSMSSPAMHSLTDSSPFAHMLERKSSAASAHSEELPEATPATRGARFRAGTKGEGFAEEEEHDGQGPGLGMSGHSTGSSRSDVAFIKKGLTGALPSESQQALPHACKLPRHCPLRFSTASALI